MQRNSVDKHVFRRDGDKVVGTAVVVWEPLEYKLSINMNHQHGFPQTEKAGEGGGRVQHGTQELGGGVQHGINEFKGKEGGVKHETHELREGGGDGSVQHGTHKLGGASNMGLTS